MDEDFENARPSRWPLWVALLLTLLWIALAGVIAAMIMRGDLGANQAVLGFVAIAAGLLLLAAPLAIVWLVASRLRENSAFQGRRAALIADHALYTEERLTRGEAAVQALDARIARLIERLDAVAGPVDARARGLDDAARTLEGAAASLLASGQRTGEATAALATAIPAAQGQTESLIELLGRAENALKAQLAETETLLAGLWTRASEAQAEARAAAQAAETRIAALTRAASDAEIAIKQPIAMLGDAADQSFVRTGEAVDATRTAVLAQTNAMLASVDQARVTLDHIGGEAARAISDRLELLLGTTARLGEQLDAQALRLAEMSDTVSQRMAALDAQLAEATSRGAASLDGLGDRADNARAAIAALDAPLAAGDAALAAIEAQLQAMMASADATLQRLGSALPAATPDIENLSRQLDALHARAAELSEPVTAGANSLESAQNRFDMAREALQSAGAELGDALDRARLLVGDIETATGNAALAANNELIEAFTRVREIAGSTAGTMRETLAGVIREAEAALDRAGNARAETAFAAPIRARIAELNEAQDKAAGAAQAASERVARHLLSLTEAVAMVERRIDEVETRFDMRARNAIGKRANDMISGLHARVVDMSRLLSFDIDDQAWTDIANGDRSAVGRRLAERLDSGAARTFARHFNHDPKFKAEAIQYLDEFEALVSGIVPEQGGSALGAALLSSTLGKLYLAIGHAAGRYE